MRKHVEAALGLISLPVAVMVGFGWGLLVEIVRRPDDDDLERWLYTTPRESVPPEGHSREVSVQEAMAAAPNHPALIHHHRRLMGFDSVYRMLWEAKERAGNVLDAVNDGSGELSWDEASYRYDLASEMFALYQARLSQNGTER